MSSKTSLKNVTIHPSMAWLVVFLPALSYFVSTRLQASGFRWGRSNNLGDPISTFISIQASSLSSSRSSCHALSKVFFLSVSNCDNALQDLPLQYSLNLQATGRGMNGIVASIWRHDENLGRGYLLFSQAHHNGRIWRWEVGGGPIAIGRSLHLESSGCRSSEYQVCHKENDAMGNENHETLSLGSGGMAIDFHHAQGSRHSDGSLVVAEWGEGRIIRMEENGARTPLMIQVPNVCSPAPTAATETETATTRVNQPRSLLYTPYGDLIVADTAAQCSKAAIYRLSQAVHVEALPSLYESRTAHAWNQTQHDMSVDLLYHASIRGIGGMVMDTTWLNVYVTILDAEGRVLLVRLPAVSTDDDDDADDDDDDEADANKDKETNLLVTDEEETEAGKQQAESPAARGVMDDKAQVILDLTRAVGSTQPGPLAVSEKGHVFLAVPQGIAIVSTDESSGSDAAAVLGILPMPAPPTSLTLGEDKFLYAFTHDSLFRIRVNVGPVMVPTNLVVGKQTSARTSS